MARQRGSLELPGNIEPQSNQPLDATRRVSTKADLTNAANFPFKWKGMDVFVESEEQWYFLKKLPLTDINNWEEFGAGSGVIVDDAMSDASTNPVQNKVIKGEIDRIDLDVSDLSASMVGVKGRLDTAEADIDALDTRVTDLEGRADQIELDVADLSASMVGVKGRLDAAEDDITQIQTDLGNVYTKTETDAKIDEKLADYDHLDYKKADSPPTATEVVIGGQTVPVVEGTRYLVPVTGENRFEEYVVLDGEVWDLGPASGSGVAQTETEITVTNPIGRFTMNEVIPAGTPLEEIDRKLLQKVSVPTLTDPKAILTFTAPTLVKVGTTVSGGSATVTLDRGKIDPAYGTSGYRSGEATGYEIAVTGGATPYSDNNDTGQFTVPDITRATPGKVTITGTASYAAGEQPKDSDGANYGTPLGAGSKSASKEIEFIAPFYYGATKTIPRTDLAGLIEDLSKKGAKTYTVATNSEYVTFAYDASYGNLKSIKDEGDQENIDGYTKTQITVDGIAYNLYISQFLTVDPAAVYKLIF